MVKVEDIAQKEGLLESEERARMQEHPKYSEEILRDLGCLTSDAVSAVRSHHERGSRPAFTQVLGIADIYEAMTHSRPYRKAKPPHQAMEEILAKESGGFQPDIIKTLVNNIGIYPAGSWVKLNTGEIGMVIESNRNYPLRPKINLLFASSGEKLKDIKFLDLLIESHLNIECPVDITCDGDGSRA
jgi:HD-GYP domain-containing protein (c-di-GMP phosphodiesterase class II)